MSVSTVATSMTRSDYRSRDENLIQQRSEGPRLVEPGRSTPQDLNRRTRTDDESAAPGKRCSPMFDAIKLLALVIMGDRGVTRDERGATAVEYGLMLALIAGVIAVAVATLGTHVLAAFTQMSSTWP